MFEVRKIKENRPPWYARWQRRLVTMLPLLKPLYRFYRARKIEHQNEGVRQSRRNFLMRIVVILLSLLFAGVCIAGVFKVLIGLNVITIDTVTSVAGTNLTSDDNGQINLLLLGQGDAEHSGKDLTDTIMIASLDPKATQSTVLISLPRDTFFLKTKRMGKGKLNTFYRDYKSYLKNQKGMAAEAASIEALRELGTEVGNKLGLPIQHVIKVNFTAFIDAVDALGGITVDVPYDIVDTEYPDENYGYQTFHINQGKQNLDGATALKYARSRHTTSDFSRSARQQQILAAMASKAQQKNIAKDPSFVMSQIRNFAENVETTLSLRELIGLVDIGKKMQRDRVIAFQMNDRNALYDGFVEPGGFLYTPPRSLFNGQSVLLPISRPEFPITWKQPQAFVSLLNAARGAYLQDPTFNILNSGARSGTARVLATELIRYGFNIENIENADRAEDLTQSVIIYKDEADEPLAKFFGQLFGLIVLYEVAIGPVFDSEGAQTRGEGSGPEREPTTVPNLQKNQLTIVLGEDYSFKPIQDILSK